MAQNRDRRAFYKQHGLLTDERLGYFLSSAAGYWSKRTLISFGDDRYTYGDIWRWSTAAARDLVARGIEPGMHVLLQTVNSVEFLVLQFAVWRIGATSVPIVPIYRRHELKAIIADVKPQAIVTNSQVKSRLFCVELDEVLKELKQRPLLKMVVGPGPDFEGWERMRRAPTEGEFVSDAGLPEPAAPDDCCVILFTSGTTSAPKGAMLSGEAIIANGHAMRRVLGITEQDVSLCATPLAHTSAFLVSVILPMAAGGRVTVLPSWKPDEAIETIERERVTFMGAPPLILQDLVERYEAMPRKGHRLGKYFGGGGVIAPSLIMRADVVGIKASRNFGMTETTGACAMCHPDEPIERRAYFDSRPFFGTEFEIVGPQREVLPQGAEGEIRIRSPQVMLGYTDPVLAAAQMDADGWFYTGDLGKLDDEGWLSVVGRIKDIINRGGEKFSTQDIEAALTSYPGIEAAAVVGAPDTRFGEVVAAFVRLMPGVEWSGPEAVLAHLESEGLAKQKFPVQWHVVDEFPRTASGKVQKQKLRDQLARGGARQNVD